jgi:hypothetical protein
LENKEMKTIESIMLSAGLSTIIAGGASAAVMQGDEITLAFQSSTPSQAVYFSFVENASSSSANRTAALEFGRAGKVNWQDYNTITFCIQIGEDVEYGNVIDFTFEPVEDTPDDPPYAGGMGGNRATMVRDLYSRWYNDVKNSDSSDLASAFQAMIWEITHETLTMDLDTSDLHLTTGAMQTNGLTTGAEGLFDQMKNSLGQGSWMDSYGDNLWGLSNPDYQDQLIVVPGAAIGFAGFGLFAARRRRQR